MNKKLKIEKNPVKDGDGIAGNGESGPDGAGGGKKEVPAAVKIAMEKAKEYKKSKGIVGGDINAGESDQISGNFEKKKQFPCSIEVKQVLVLDLHTFRCLFICFFINGRRFNNL